MRDGAIFAFVRGATLMLFWNAASTDNGRGFFVGAFHHGARHSFYMPHAKRLRAPFMVASEISERTKVITTGEEWQNSLMASAVPLEPTPLSQALATLQRDGVVRIDGRDVSVDPTLCTKLREKIIQEVKSGESRWENYKESDKIYVPGTRLRFTDPVDLAFSGISRRHDLLLPLASPEGWMEVSTVLQSAAQQLHPLLIDAAEALLPRIHGGVESNDHEEDGPLPSLEIVELASLLSCPGSNTQGLHGDYRRFHHEGGEGRGIEDIISNSLLNAIESSVTTEKRRDKLPPRLVTFVALQDVPTVQHGSTGFLTGTHNSQAHEWIYEYNGGKGIEVNCEDDPDGATVAAVVQARQSLLEISSKNAGGVRTASQFRAGDVLVYDASVLHWGGPNVIANNDRAIMYFGVARPGAAGILCNKKEEMVRMGFELAHPVLLQNVM